MAKSTERVKKFRANLETRLRAAFGNKCGDCGARERLEFAHVVPTEISKIGRGRGKLDRLIDVRDNFLAYRLLCRPCHDVFDGRACNSPQSAQRTQR